MKSIEKVVTCLNKTLQEHPEGVNDLMKNIFYIKMLNDVLRAIDLPPITIVFSKNYGAKRIIGFSTLSK